MEIDLTGCRHGILAAEESTIWDAGPWVETDKGQTHILEVLTMNHEESLMSEI